MAKNIKLSVIIPVFNEKKTISQVLSQVSKTKLVYEIIVVDDGSTDGTTKILKNYKSSKRIKIVFKENNLGKGAAIKSGIKYLTGDYLIVQDADLEYDPKDFKKLINPVLEGKALVVYGSRFTGEHRNLFFWHMLANKTLTLLTNILYDTTLSDMETCYKLIPVDLIKKIKLKSNCFAFEPEITAKILKQGIRIYEVPISYAGREYRDGKKITFWDGAIAFWALFKYRFFD